MSSRQFKQTNPACDFRPDPSDPLHGLYGIHEHDTRFVRSIVKNTDDPLLSEFLREFEKIQHRTERNDSLLDFQITTAPFACDITLFPLDWLKKLDDESYAEFSIRNQKTYQNIIGTGLPMDYFIPTNKVKSPRKIKQQVEKQLEQFSNPINREYFKYASLMSDFTDKDICMIADAIAKQKESGFSKIQSRRKTRTLLRQSREHTAHILGLVGKGRKYLMCTEKNIRERREQNLRNEESSAKLEVKINGSMVKISDLRDKVLQNRVNETFVMMKGMELEAKRLGMEWAMVTFTASPSFHPGTPNKYEGALMTEAHREIHGKMRAIWKDFNRADIFVSGSNGIEFHKDGCPHIHSTIFYHPYDKKEIQGIIDKQFTLTFNHDEHGVEGKPHANWMQGDSKKSKPSSYAMGYALKSMLAAKNKKMTPEQMRADSLHSTWNLRRFSVFGVPSKTTWRTSRELINC